MKNAQNFPSEIGHFKYDHRFLFNREMGNIRSWKYVRQANIHFTIFQVKNEE